MAITIGLRSMIFWRGRGREISLFFHGVFNPLWFIVHAELVASWIYHLLYFICMQKTWISFYYINFTILKISGAGFSPEASCLHRFLINIEGKCGPERLRDPRFLLYWQGSSRNGRILTRTVYISLLMRARHAKLNGRPWRCNALCSFSSWISWKSTANEPSFVFVSRYKIGLLTGALKLHQQFLCAREKAFLVE